MGLEVFSFFLIFCRDPRFLGQGFGSLGGVWVAPEPRRGFGCLGFGGGFCHDSRFLGQGFGSLGGVWVVPEPRRGFGCLGFGGGLKRFGVLDFRGSPCWFGGSLGGFKQGLGGLGVRFWRCLFLSKPRKMPSRNRPLPG